MLIKDKGLIMDDTFFDLAYAQNEMDDIADRVAFFAEDYPELRGVLLKKLKEKLNENEEVGQN